MQRLTSMLAMIAWALWFGALMALFVFVLALFHSNREIAVQAAPQLFVAFERYHLILAGVALAATVAWRIVAPSKLVLASFAMLAIAACCGVVIAIWYVAPMNALRLQGLADSDEFKRLHGESMWFFMGQAITLLINGIILPFAICASGGKRSAQTAQAPGSPA